MNYSAIHTSHPIHPTIPLPYHPTPAHQAFFRLIFCDSPIIIFFPFLYPNGNKQRFPLFSLSRLPPTHTHLSSHNLHLSHSHSLFYFVIHHDSWDLEVAFSLFLRYFLPFFLSFPIWIYPKHVHPLLWRFSFFLFALRLWVNGAGGDRTGQTGGWMALFSRAGGSLAFTVGDEAWRQMINEPGWQARQASKHTHDLHQLERFQYSSSGGCTLFILFLFVL